MFNRENPQNSEPQNGPRSGLDYIALRTHEGLTYINGSSMTFKKVLKKKSLTSLKIKKTYRFQ